MLSLWDAAALDAAGEDGEVIPMFINLSDASIKMVRLVIAGLVMLSVINHKSTDRIVANEWTRRRPIAERPQRLYCCQQSLFISFQLP